MEITHKLVKISSLKVRIRSKFHKTWKLIIAVKKVLVVVVAKPVKLIKKITMIAPIPKKLHPLKIQIDILHNKNKCNKRIASKMIIIIVVVKNNSIKNHKNPQTNRNNNNKNNSNNSKNQLK